MFFGASLGSFINLLFERSSNHESIVLPPSHCNQCQRTLTIIEKIPILGYLFSKGKCAECNFKIPMVYLSSEVYLGLISAGLQIENYEDYLVLIIAALMLYMSLSDLKSLCVPSITLYITFLVSLIITSKSFATIIIILLCYIGTYLVNNWHKFNLIGNGDIDVLFIFFIIYEIQNVIKIIFIASFLALIYIKFSEKDKIAFIPFLTTGFLVNYLI
ncbi:prepilin peptidase [Apilactobacillus ozensis]|uniref:prepilin peptidase n=1 Tax=Apilactobacillus ozensis TaxID=866801 RepID=UPI003242D66C|nr:prepilin peptidase [Apilactobacillus ozensis]